MSYALNPEQQTGDKSATQLDARLLEWLRNPWAAYFAALAVVGAIARWILIGNVALGYNEAGYAVAGWRLYTGHGDLAAYYSFAPGYAQLLSLVQIVFGAADVFVHLLPVLTSIAAVILCAPLGRAIGRPAAATAALVLAISPFWLRITSNTAPDGTAVCLALLAAALLVHAREYRWMLPASAVTAGYMLSFGTSGIWLCCGVLALMLARAIEIRNPLYIASAAVGFGIAAIAGPTTFFSYPLNPSAAIPERVIAGYASAGDIVQNLLLSAPLYLIVLALIATAVSVVFRRNAEGRSFRAPSALILISLALLVLAVVLPEQFKPSPAVVWLPLTFAAAWLLPTALSTFVESRASTLITGGVVLILSLISLFLPANASAIVTVPGGLAAAASPPATVRDTLQYVRKVSWAVYRNDRDPAHPQGGTQLTAQVSPVLANWGLWYLRELDSVTVSNNRQSYAQVQVLAGDSNTPPTGYVNQTFGKGNQAITLAWAQNIWDKIDPESGKGLQLKAQYNLFGHPPPGNRPGQLFNPTGIAIAPNGDIYVVDQGNSRVEKFAPNGKFLLQWGSAGKGEGQFGNSGTYFGPTGIAASKQYVWVADTWNHRIEQFTTNGQFVRTWGSYYNTQGDPKLDVEYPTSFYGPRDIAIGPDGLLYITDTGNKRVVVYTQDGKFVRQWGSVGKGPNQLDEPVGIAVGKQGHVYVADARNQRIQVFTSKGKPLKRWHVDLWQGDGRLEPYIALDGKGNVYVTNPMSDGSNPLGHSVVEYSANGTRIADYGSGTNNALISPIGLAVTEDGKVYVVDSGLSQVIRLSDLGEGQ